MFTYSAIEKSPEAHPAVLGVVPGDELGVGFEQVERRPVRLSGARREEDQQPDELRRGEPDRVLLLGDDVRERVSPP